MSTDALKLSIQKVPRVVLLHHQHGTGTRKQSIISNDKEVITAGAEQNMKKVQTMIYISVVVAATYYRERRM